MNERIKQLALQTANEIADQFTPGFFDDRMVSDITNIIYKHHKKSSEMIVEECRNVLADVYNEVPLECSGHFLYADEVLAKHFYGEKE
jgi:hypothetical protein